MNENQRAAVEADAHPTLVLAGPGSGKTTVLTWRALRVISESAGAHYRVLGLTFTQRAATEMRSRVEAHLVAGLERTTLTTFHSFAAEILRQHGSHVGIQPDFTVLGQETDRRALLQDAIRDGQEEHPELERDDVRLLPLIDNLLEKLVPLAEAADHIRDPELAEKVGLLYTVYRERLKSENTLDFATLLCLADELLTLRPAIARQLRSTYVHILVDEFQDTNLGQYRFLRRIVGADPANLFVVADEDQMIYQWNGADPKRLDDLRSEYEMRIIQLPTNYRCPAAVLDLANALIAHNPGRSEDRLPLEPVVARDDRRAVRLVAFDDAQAEARFIGRKLAELSKADREGAVIIARTRRVLTDALPHLEESGIQVSLMVRKTDFESAPFRWLVGMLRLAAGRGDRQNLAVVLRAFYLLQGVKLSVDDITASAAARGGDFLRSFLEEALAHPDIDSKTGDLLSAGRELSDQLNYWAFVNVTLEWLGGPAASAGAGDQNAFDEFATETEIWTGIVDGIKGRYPGQELPLPAFLQELDLSPKTPPVPPGAVRCFTVHNAKGMEFPRVFLMGLAEDVLPSFHAVKAGNESEQMQEERRNCFVALTRTSEELTVTYAREYFNWTKRPSRFLGEMGLAAQ